MSMKKIISFSLLLICGLVLLLATVDLEPYLSSGSSDILEEVSLPPVQEKDQILPQIDANAQPENQPTVILVEENNNTRPDNTQWDDISANKNDATPGEDAPIGQQTTGASPAKVDDDVELGQTSSLIEMEIMVLPAGEYPYSILLETFLKQESAQQAILKYQERGISAFWVKVNLGNKVIRFRVFTGTFSTETEAQLYLENHQLSGKLVRPTTYSALVGVYQDKAQLITDIVKTRETGVIPYILRTAKDDYFLYVGAFYTFNGANSQCISLEKAGISCKPVKRSTIPPQQP